MRRAIYMLDKTPPRRKQRSPTECDIHILYTSKKLLVVLLRVSKNLMHTYEDLRGRFIPDLT